MGDSQAIGDRFVAPELLVGACLSTMLSGMRQYNAGIKSLDGKHGAKVVDLEAAIPKTREYFKDDVHYTTLTMPFPSSPHSSKGASYLVRDIWLWKAIW